MLNGKVYIGQTVLTLTRRRQSHFDAAKRGSKNHFHKAIRKYGRDVFDWKVIDTATSREELGKLEAQYINEYDSIRRGYNEVTGGYGGSPFKKGDEIYDKIKHKLGKWKNGNPGATKEAIEKRIESFKTVNWPRGDSHGNSKRKKSSKLIGDKNPAYGKYPHCQLVEIDGTVYNSLGEAATKYNTTRRTVRNRCMSDRYPTWKLLHTEKQRIF